MVPPGSSGPPGGPRIIVKYQVTTFNLHRMPTLLIVRHKEKRERCLRGWLAFASSPGENNVSGMAGAAASPFVGSKFVFESPSTVWPLALQ